ncbi:MAG: cytochrome c, partial [Gammaproteobacteria bacterium]|nr:cytochrome c [Gammaproteobacteria bacterium]
WSCGVCHVLGDAGGTGHIGPSLDGNAAMDVEFIAARINNGQGAMPGFGGQMTDEEIDLLARYVMQAKQ